MASLPLLAISAASETARPSNSDHNRRRLMRLASVPFVCTLPRPKPRRELVDDRAPVGIAQPRPLFNFEERAPAAAAHAGGMIERANLDASRFDSRHWQESGMNRTCTISGPCCEKQSRCLEGFKFRPETAAA